MQIVQNKNLTTNQNILSKKNSFKAFCVGYLLKFFAKAALPKGVHMVNFHDIFQNSGIQGLNGINDKGKLTKNDCFL